MFFENRDRSAAIAKAVHAFNFGLAFLILSLGTYIAFAALETNWNWHSAYGYKTKFIEGWLISLGIAASSLILSLAIGLGAALAKRSSLLVLRYLASIYIEITRGTPLLVQIFFFFYVVANSAGLENRFLVGAIIMALFSGAYIAEIIRSGIESVGHSQLQSARAIGLTSFQSYRFVIMPQAVRRSLPALAGQFANLIKDSSLLSIIGIRELTLNAQEVNSFILSPFESYFPLAVGYLILTLPIMRLSRWIEKRLEFQT